jgi:hypothetical protein
VLKPTVSPTANAKSVVVAAGTNLPQLFALVDQHVIDLRILLKQVIALHPAGDANLTALNNVLSELN